MESILARRSFHPVFQPILTLEGNRVIGHAALTRLESGTAPDLVFAKAASTGLEVALDLACLHTAVTGARDLASGDTWLSLAAGADRPVVLELTEHVVIEDYGPVRGALTRLSPTFKLAVDDVGSGFPSLRHILELAPDFVKLDILLVRDVDQDPGRQELVAGHVSFASRAGCGLIAEGWSPPRALRAPHPGCTLRRSGLLARSANPRSRQRAGAVGPRSSRPPLQPKSANVSVVVR